MAGDCGCKKAARPRGASCDQIWTDPAQLVGQRIARRYQLCSIIGRGSNAVVYRGVDLSLRQEVAAKVVLHRPGVTEALVDRLADEARVLASLRHPAIPLFLGLLEDPQLHALLIEFVAGGDLEQQLRARGRALSVSQIKGLMGPILSAVGYAHRAGIVHQDIKPANILVSGLQGRVSAKLADFGVSKELRVHRVTGQVDLVSGTVLYMSPEQCLRPAHVDYPSDIYSLGVTLYQLATGAVPFSFASAQEVMRAHAYYKPPRPTSINPDLSFELEQLILRAMEKNPQRRFRSAEEMATALMSISELDDETSEYASAAAG